MAFGFLAVLFKPALSVGSVALSIIFGSAFSICFSA
jgi:hypothetical protein